MATHPTVDRSLTYHVSCSYIGYIVHGSPEGLSDQEQADAEQFMAQVVHDDAHGRAGHWAILSADTNNWACCAVSGERTGCHTLAYHLDTREI